MCGDHEQPAKAMECVRGSPPHVRGPHNEEYRQLQVTGITPACAGTTTVYL